MSCSIQQGLGKEQVRGNSLCVHVSTMSSPYLEDHGFQGLTVLPGCWYVAHAMEAYRKRLQSTPGKIRSVQFFTPVILSPQSSSLALACQSLNERTVEYRFISAAGKNPGAGVESPCARLEIESADPWLESAPITPHPSLDLQQGAHRFYDRQGFYDRLQKKGNQYGPSFQNLRGIWRKGQTALGRLHVPRPEPEGTAWVTLLLDGAVQVLATFHLEHHAAFVLQGIAQIGRLASVYPDEIWVRAALRPGQSYKRQEWIGDVDAFDDAGHPLLALQGVHFTCLEPGTQPEKESPTQVLIAADFTAEPVQDALQFWSEYLEWPVQVSFAPYNQVMQQLLDPKSELSLNQNGFNVVLLSLEDWDAGSSARTASAAPTRATLPLADRERYALPNGLEIAHLNRYETAYGYQEIFADECYLRHGIQLPADAVVIDIGANIGLFSLLVRCRCPGARVYAFEPSPVTFSKLKANCEAYGPGLYPFNVGVMEQRGCAPFTFYTKSSLFSTFRPAYSEDGRAIRAVISNLVHRELPDGPEAVTGYVDELMADRLNHETFDCPTVSVSEIIRENNLRRVDLLKVDAERCEVEILRGIDDDLWPLIGQVVVEVHDHNQQMSGEVQRVLAQHGFHCVVEEEELLTGSGLFHVYATRHRLSSKSDFSPASQHLPAGVRSRADQMVQALRSFRAAKGTWTILCVCPATRQLLPGASADRARRALEDYLLRQVSELPHVRAISSRSIQENYPAFNFLDVYANQAGHIPYSPEGYAAVGSALFRAFLSQRRPPAKLIALDCDGTLWQGACGEDGPLLVAVTSAHRALQNFLLEQRAAGLLLCLCSKNNKAEVWTALDQHPDLALRREHLAAWRINWRPKSENLQSLAQELQVGLESIIFLDDSAIECAEVRANCPEVVALQMPGEAADWKDFLRHTWCFDHGKLTRDDRMRAQRTLDSGQRESYRRQVSTLREFIDGLGLQVTLRQPEPGELSRLSQLTLRTNQFNSSAQRRSESDLLRYLETPSHCCLAAKVSDRFGDYGLVGLLLYEVEENHYHVNTLLLSCRVLGRGVEHQMLAQIGRLALNDGRPWTRLLVRRTERNRPVWDFLEAIGALSVRPVEDGALFELNSERLAVLRYEPELHATSSRRLGDAAAVDEPKPHPAPAAKVRGFSEKLQGIAENLREPEGICRAIQSSQSRPLEGGVSATDRLPDTLEGKVLRIWRQILRNPDLGLDDYFVDAGGTSMKAVQVVAALRRELDVEVSISSLYEHPSVGLLCRNLSQLAPNDSPASEARQRGARRKLRTQNHS